MKLTFNTESEAIAAENQIWINYVKSKNEYGDPEKSKVYGVKDGVRREDSGVTTKYDEIIKAYNLNKWYFEKPDESLMIDVIGFTEEKFNEDWAEPMPN